MNVVAVRDLETGAAASRPSDTPTLDVPVDLASGTILTVADGFRASYTTAAGKQVTRKVTPEPLGWRAQGETCLVARSGGARRARQRRRRRASTRCSILSERARPKATSANAPGSSC